MTRVNLFGAPGYGKTEVSLYVGHKESGAGRDVYYISVEVLPNVKILVEELFDIRKFNVSPDDDKLKSWSKLIYSRSLLILDDVNGRWVSTEGLASFQKDFIEVLLQYSHQFQKNLKILVLSQQELKLVPNFRSLHLLPPSIQSCVTMFAEFASEASDYVTIVTDQFHAVSKDEVETVCTQVGQVPKAVEVLASALSPPLVTVENLTKELEEYDVKQPGNSTRLGAFEVVFDFIHPKCQICCLLLARFPSPGFLSACSSYHYNSQSNDTVQHKFPVGRMS